MYGLPTTIFSDRAKEFQAVLEELCNALGVKKYMTTGYQPQANASQVERLHRFMGSSLTILAAEDPHSWDHKLAIVMFGYRTS